MSAHTNKKYDYIVVGSGAGGGTVAARLAEAGKQVLLLEAGGDPLASKGTDAVSPDENRLPEDYQVPVFHAISSENNAMKWNYFIDHYSETQQQIKDPKYKEDWTQEQQGPSNPIIGGATRPDIATGNTQLAKGILYPRAGTLGGCTSHNAMITVYPHNDDWDYIESLTGDPSWNHRNMRKYFQSIENCHHRPIWRWLSKIGFNPTQHGFKGWLHTEAALPIKALAADRALIDTVIDSVFVALDKVAQKTKRIKWLTKGLGDPNDWRLVKQNSIGVRYPPLATKAHKRNGSRERVLEVAEQTNNLHIQLHALVNRVIFEGTVAVGVEYAIGEKLYRASHNANQEQGELHQTYVEAGGEIILSGGAFNTPQLLMLSGVGDKTQLTEHGIDCVVDLPSVGKNLQDRYEVGVVNRMNFAHWQALKGAKFAKGDPQYQQWQQGKGVYTTNGAVIAVIKRSLQSKPLPDLFMFALLGLFRGYYPSYSTLFPNHLNYLTWAVLKAHTLNNAGFVKLRSSDPKDPPIINFKYFDEGNDQSQEDLQAVVEGVKFVREMTKPLIQDGTIAEEVMPGKDVQTDEQIADFVKNRAWGHHASCTCAIGPRDKSGVLNSDFEVYGTQGLRVVDASVFPKIPGFFIVTSVYMVGEKAADVILQKEK